ncbi:hypothetical protein RHMOL_Rhmol07G0321800 [Rhododendron molle]|uniref:Uncharacterized protein n=1 Tax=Rhododendron molle TaxID=49168 RepID=A0ACC0N7U5_RHOML|nr:hypothetical protein RHMOL_Rhmol07G0321800 [Rhododendron molle]
MAAQYSGNKTPNTHLLQELEALSQTLYQNPTTNRRTNSLALPRSSVPPIPIDDAKPEEEKLINPKPRQRRMSLSPWRSRPRLEDDHNERSKAPRQRPVKKLDDTATSSDKKGLWNWKPIRALSHIGMQKLSCLFSIEVVAVQGLPASMNGLRLSVCVRKKETKDGAVHTMPSRVSQGAADFEETLFIRCHVYCTSSGATSQLKFEPRPFVIYVFAVDAEELDFGRSSVDLSHLIQESIEKNSEGTRVRQWDTSFNLSGKAKGGELVLKLGFQLMEKDGGVGIYNRAEGQKSKGKSLTSPSSNFARKQSKSSFSIASPRMSSRAEAWTPSQSGMAADLQGIDDLNLDEPATVPLTSPSVKKSEEPESNMEDLELPEFDIVDKGVEMIQDKTDKTDEDQSEENSDKRWDASEVVKEVVVHDQVHLTRLTELDSIAQQIKALESLMGNEKPFKTEEEETASPKLEADEETVTREFLQMLEGEEADEYKLNQLDDSPMKFEGVTAEDSTELESKVFVPDLGKGLGCVVQTRNGGYLAAMNPLDTEVLRKDTPKLAMQISKPLVLPTDKSSGFEALLQQLSKGGTKKVLTQKMHPLMFLQSMERKCGEEGKALTFILCISSDVCNRSKAKGDANCPSHSNLHIWSLFSTLHWNGSTYGQPKIFNIRANKAANDLTEKLLLAFLEQKNPYYIRTEAKIRMMMAVEGAYLGASPAHDDLERLDSFISSRHWLPAATGGWVCLSHMMHVRDLVIEFYAENAPMLNIYMSGALLGYAIYEKIPSTEPSLIGDCFYHTALQVLTTLLSGQQTPGICLHWLMCYQLVQLTCCPCKGGQCQGEVLHQGESLDYSPLITKECQNPKMILSR